MTPHSSVRTSHPRAAIDVPAERVTELLEATFASSYARRDPLARELGNLLNSMLLDEAPADRASAVRIRGILSTESAAHCVLDWARTYRFVHAIHDAVKKIESERPGREIFAVDAGAGPFAFLAVVAALQSANVRAVAIEANSHSVRCARAVVQKLGLSDRIQIIQEDALTFRAGQPIDLFLTETFDSGLQREQGAKIIRHFSNQMQEHGFMIPREVAVEASLRKKSGILRMSPDYWKTLYRADLSKRNFQDDAVVIGKDLRPGAYEIFLSTRLGFGSGIADLDRHYDSPISQPTLARTFKISSTPNIVVAGLSPGSESLDVFVE